ncbi:uncharacterized protein [Musca autumnalis]|uniref:uncharacterized protein n=1 Tax=Musca autumnalis TaxID=221902 RepID=UPI003CE6A9BA
MEKYCRLCARLIGAGCEHIYDGNNFPTEIYKLVVIYFSEEFLRMEWSTPFRSICWQCSRWLREFHKFRDDVFTTQKKLIVISASKSRIPNEVKSPHHASHLSSQNADYYNPTTESLHSNTDTNVATKALQILTPSTINSKIGTLSQHAKGMSESKIPNLIGGSLPQPSRGMSEPTITNSVVGNLPQLAPNVANSVGEILSQQIMNNLTPNVRNSFNGTFPDQAMDMSAPRVTNSHGETVPQQSKDILAPNTTNPIGGTQSQQTRNMLSPNVTNSFKGTFPERAIDMSASSIANAISGTLHQKTKVKNTMAPNVTNSFNGTFPQQAMDMSAPDVTNSFDESFHQQSKDVFNTTCPIGGTQTQQTVDILSPNATNSNCVSLPNFVANVANSIGRALHLQANDILAPNATKSIGRTLAQQTMGSMSMTPNVTTSKVPTFSQQFKVGVEMNKIPSPSDTSRSNVSPKNFYELAAEQIENSILNFSNSSDTVEHSLKLTPNVKNLNRGGCKRLPLAPINTATQNLYSSTSNTAARGLQILAPNIINSNKEGFNNFNMSSAIKTSPNLNITTTLGAQHDKFI